MALIRCTRTAQLTNNKAACVQLQQYLGKYFFRSYASETTAWERAEPLSKMPGYTKWQLVRTFMPGGRLHNKSFTDILRISKEDFGNIFFIPGILDKPDSVITFNPDDFAMVVRTEGVWPKRNSFETLLEYRLKHRKDYFQDVMGLLASNGEQWGTFRSAVNPVLMQPKTVTNYLPKMSKASKEFIERIKEIRDPNTLEVPANFIDEINRWTLESVALVALDQQLGLLRANRADKESAEFFQHIKTFLELFTDLEVAPPFWKIYPTPTYRRMMKTQDGITNFVEKHLEEIIKNAEKSTEKRPTAEQSVLEQLLKTDRKIASVMALDMIFAGIDTTSSAFTAIMLCLAKFPEKQQKLREEIVRVLPEKGSTLTSENMKNMPYLRACLKEALRVYPVVAGSIRNTNKDIVLSGYRVPKDTDVAMISIDILKDPQHYPQPEKFIPERWLRQNENTSTDCPGKSNHPFAYLPFGIGPRMCVGKRIVELELEIGITQIIRQFQVEFKYSTDGIFKSVLINTPVKPLKFKFTDI